MLYIFLALSGVPVSLIQQHWFCLLLALLPFDQMSNEVGAITVFSRLEIIEGRQEAWHVFNVFNYYCT